MAATPAPAADVLVVGAGPVGLLTAIELRRAGADVLLVDRLRHPTGESRASQLSARTMEILDTRGLREALESGMPERMGHFGGLPVDVGDVDSPFAGLWKVPQFRTEAVLSAAAARLGVPVARGRRLVSLRQDTHGVSAILQTANRAVHVRCAYLVGCDGAAGTVRGAAGIGYPGRLARRRLLRADVAGVTVPDRRFERLPTGMAVAARRPDGVTRLMVHEFDAPPPQDRRPPSFADLGAAWHRVTGEQVGHGEPLWVDAFDDETRQAERYRSGRVLIAGDAAHVHMPIGGQALNLGLQDAVNLGWKLAAVVAGRASDVLLDSYHDEQHVVGARVLADVAAQQEIQLGGGEVLPMRALLAEVLALPSVRHLVARRLAGLDVRYPVGEGSSGHAWEGARAPYLPLRIGGRSADLGRLHDSARPVLLCFGAPAADRAAGATRAWGGRVRRLTADDVPQSAATDAASPGRVAEAAALDAVLLRPDGHVMGTVVAGGDPRELVPALTRWAGPPRSHRAPSGAGSIPGGGHR